ncbi:AmmeMemoRadiSam system protein A [Photobacterium halotolerans]|uniref:AmmeMemoRadiSam system protein A n=1 Tax=Photobacterium halotolerans TaxID=265726 RepID=A0A7X4WEB0_9GAMM|nr:AmmeMemoRadiSam system protein A [Photobacterium halotolerans]NAW65815.1 AmmeMemoRadiSam system protein A [Photobacterium halotolerans]NAW86949.1 AmmeMemoRadiSam system protein A [Photobacterium halotolerans]
MSVTSCPPPPKPALNKGEMTQLLDIAREAIRSHFSEALPRPPQLDLYNRKLLANGACFVTLEVDGELQGCLGTVTANEPLVLEVHNKARDSAYQDRRFMPLTEEQLSSLTIEISVLSDPKLLQVDSEEALIAYLEEHKVGVILTEHHSQAVFLPQVWDKLASPAAFVKALKQKAGWPINHWSPNVRVKTFTTTQIKGKYFSQFV